jgi:hypothetical protein
MPVREQATHQSVTLAFEGAISSNTTTAGAIIDTAHFDAGIYFALAATTYTDGTYALKIEDGDDAALADAADVATTQLVYGTLPSVSAVLADGSDYSKEGVIGTKRYVRASIVSTGVTTGATLSLICIKGAELLKTAQ